MLLFGCFSSRQNEPGSSNSSFDLSFYEKSANYIKNSDAVQEYLAESFGNHKANIEISKSVVYLEYVYFAEEILKDRLGYKQIDLNLNYEALEVVSDSLDKVDNERVFEKYNLDELGRISETRNGSSILFFSKLHNNTLAAELLINRHKKKEFSSLTFLNTGLRFLFVFSSNGEIEKVYTTEISYN
jgi:hypothetical protein